MKLELTERGNVLLAHDEEFWLNAWLKLPGENNWLEIAYRRENYPALNVNTVVITEEQLATHIRESFGGGLWTARKLNLEGVTVDDSCHIVGNEDE